MELKESLTGQNLMTAFSAESQTENKYILFAEKAEQEGFHPIAEIFREIAQNERIHSEIWLSYLGTIGTTKQNLASAEAGEHYEWSEMYHAFAETARSEGFDDVAIKMEAIGQIEAEHEKCFSNLLEKMQDNRLFSSSPNTIWRCSNCGYVHIGANAPNNCPVCGHDKSWFKAKNS